jgi:monoamine oxidase
LAEELHPGAIHLSSPVKKISQQGGNRSTVEIANGRTYECKRVIVSVPSTLYSLIEFSPTLPRAKHDYAESTQLGMYAKTIFVYERPWWREHGLSGILDSVVGLISFSRDTCIEEDKQYSITCFIVGETGRRWSKLSAAARIQQVTNQLERAFQKRVQNVPQPINIIEQDWSKEPWIRGVPCPFTPPGVLTSDAGKAIRVPVGNLHFVGTETAFFWKGYMEGAVRSGTREAAEVIEVLAPEKT